MKAILSKPREQFISQIIDNSIAEVYEVAIQEWDLLLQYSRPQYDYTDCICGQPIINCCLIKNRITHKILIIGTTCKTKYIESINNISKSNLSVIYNAKVINLWEFEFMESVARFTSHSEKQRVIYKRIVDKIIKYYQTNPIV